MEGERLNKSVGAPYLSEGMRAYVSRQLRFLRNLAPLRRATQWGRGLPRAPSYITENVCTAILRASEGTYKARLEP